MKFFDYVANVREDAENYISANYDSSVDFDDFYCDMELSVTGNDNGSYYCNSYCAREAVSEVLFDPDFLDAVQSYGTDIFTSCFPGDLFELLLDPEGVDVMVRIVVLSILYGELEEYYDSFGDNDEE